MKYRMDQVGFLFTMFAPVLVIYKLSITIFVYVSKYSSILFDYCCSITEVKKDGNMCYGLSKIRIVSFVIIIRVHIVIGFVLVSRIVIFSEIV